MRSIVAATDLTARGSNAVRRGGELAARLGARLTLIHVVDEELPARMRAHMLADAAIQLDEDVAALAAQGAADVRRRVETGVPHGSICAVAVEEQADLLVIGPHRRSRLKDMFVGTTAERLLRRADRPVLVAHSATPAPYRRVLVGVDLVEEAREAIACAQALAAPTPVHLAHVRVDSLDIQVAAYGSEDALRRQRRAVERRIEAILRRLADAAGASHGALRVLPQGPVIDGLLAAAAEAQTDLVTLGTTTGARSAFERWLVASRTEQAVIEADVDLLCVPLSGATPIADAPGFP